jgi:glycosyltransferase involved in cell wall biosynthesis
MTTSCAVQDTGIIARRTLESRISVFLMINTLQIGGTERQFIVLAQNLSKSRFHLHLGCVSQRGALAQTFPDINEFPLGGSLYGLGSLLSRLSLKRHLHQNQVQIVHAFGFYANLVLIPTARLARVPVVIGSHRQLGDLMTPAQFRAQALAFRYCDAIVCNSRAAASCLESVGVCPDKLQVIGNAVPFSLFKSAVPLLPEHPRPLRVGMVARMNVHYKNHSSFLRIALEIHKQMPHVEFVLVGDGALRPEIEREAVALGLRERIVFLGERSDIPGLLKSLDVAVLTSRSESSSNFILEAMAAGVPVVAYSVGGNTELIGNDRGSLIAVGNEAEFAKAVLELLSNSDFRVQRGALGQQYVEANFTLDRVLKQYEDLYVRLLVQRNRGERACES